MDYKKTIIYKIVCNDLAVKDLYVGHTTNFKVRKISHKTRCTNPNDVSYNFQVYEFIRNNGCWNNWTMIEIEKFPCNDANEARARERYWCEQLNATLNNNIPSRNKQQYYEDKKKEILEYHKDYYIENKDKILEKHKQKIECECGLTYTFGHKSRHIKCKRHLELLNTKINI